MIVPKEFISITSIMDGKAFRFPVAPKARKQFERGKCWTFYCQNPIWFIHLNVHGIADFGQCYCCAERRALEYFVKNLRVKGRFVMPEKGRSVEWRFNEDTKSFSPIK